MSVHAADRGDSVVQFLVDLKKLAIYVSKFVGKRSDSLSKPFRNVYAEEVCKLAINAYNHAATANGIFISEQFTRQDLELRRALFQQAYSEVKSLTNSFEIYLWSLRDLKDLNQKKFENAIEEVSKLSHSIRKSITNIIKSDVSKAGKMNKTRIEKDTELLKKLLNEDQAARVNVIMTPNDFQIIKTEALVASIDDITKPEFNNINNAINAKDQSNFKKVAKVKRQAQKQKTKNNNKGRNSFLDNANSKNKTKLNPNFSCKPIQPLVYVGKKNGNYDWRYNSNPEIKKPIHFLPKDQFERGKDPGYFNKIFDFSKMMISIE